RGALLDLRDRAQHGAQRARTQALQDAARLDGRGEARAARRGGRRARARGPARRTAPGGRPRGGAARAARPPARGRGAALHARAVVRRDRRGYRLSAGDAEVALPPRYPGAQAAPWPARRGRRAMRHPSADALLELHFDEALPGERAPLEEHLRGCAECASFVSELRRLERELAPGPDDAPPRDGLERVLARVAAVRPARRRSAEWAMAAGPCAAA